MNKDIIDHPYSIPDIASNGSEVIHYDDPDFMVFARKNHNLAAYMPFPGLTLHYHPDIEMIYIREGRAAYQLNEKVIHMNEGDGIIVTPNQLHLLLSEGVDHDLDCVIFHPSLLSTSPIIAKKYLPLIFGETAPDCFVLRGGDAGDRSILQKIEQITHLSILGDREMDIIALIHQICQKLYDKVKDAPVSVQGNLGELDIVRAMLDFIHEHYAEKITVDDICRAGNVGKNVCTALFNKYTHLSPIDYVRHFRVSSAISYLDFSDKSLTEIAYLVGFNSASYFTETFRQYFHMTPGQYRAKKTPER